MSCTARQTSQHESLFRSVAAYWDLAAKIEVGSMQTRQILCVAEILVSFQARGYRVPRACSNHRASASVHWVGNTGWFPLEPECYCWTIPHLGLGGAVTPPPACMLGSRTWVPPGQVAVGKLRTCQT